MPVADPGLGTKVGTEPHCHPAKVVAAEGNLRNQFDPFIWPLSVQKIGSTPYLYLPAGAGPDGIGYSAVRVAR